MYKGVFSVFYEINAGMEKRGKDTGRASQSGVCGPLARAVRFIPNEPRIPSRGRAGSDLRLKVRPLAAVGRTALAGPRGGNPARVQVRNQGDAPGEKTAGTKAGEAVLLDRLWRQSPGIVPIDSVRGGRPQGRKDDFKL